MKYAEVCRTFMLAYGVMHPVEVQRRAMFGDFYDTMVEGGMFDDGIECPPEERVVRDEFAREASIEFQLKQFQAGMPFRRQFTTGEADMDIDLLAAQEMVSDAYEVFNRLPKAVRDVYGTFGELEAAIQSGEFLRRFPKEKPKEEPPKS